MKHRLKAQRSEAKATPSRPSATSKRPTAARRSSKQRDEARQPKRAASANAVCVQHEPGPARLGCRRHRRVHELLEQHRPKPGETDLRGFEWHYQRAKGRRQRGRRSREGARGNQTAGRGQNTKRSTQADTVCIKHQSRQDGLGSISRRPCSEPAGRSIAPSQGSRTSAASNGIFSTDYATQMRHSQVTSTTTTLRCPA